MMPIEPRVPRRHKFAAAFMTLLLGVMLVVTLPGCRTSAGAAALAGPAATNVLQEDPRSSEQGASGPESAGSEQPEAEPASSSPEPTIENDYDVETLLQSVVMLEEQLLSVDYFGQYLWGDWIFEDYLERMFRLDPGAYEHGEGSLLTVQEPQMLSGAIHRAVISRDEEGAEWWQMRQKSGEAELFCEVEVSALDER